MTTNIPPSGPTARLQLNDPATWVMILSAVGAVAVKAVPAIAGWGIEQLYPSFALLAAALVIGWGLYSKHHLAAALATVLPPAEAVVAQVTAAPAAPAQPAPVPDPAVTASAP